MAGALTSLAQLRIVGIVARKAISLVIQTWNLILFTFVAGDLKATVIDRSGDRREVELQTVTAGPNPTMSGLNAEVDLPAIEMQSDAKELLWIGVTYDGPLAFHSIRWWVRLSDGYRILRESDVRDEELPALDETSFHADDSVLINPEKEPQYGNIARSPTDDNHFYVIERNYVRWELERYASGQMALGPIWLETPEHSTGDHTLQVEIDPPNTPITIYKSIEIRLN